MDDAYMLIGDGKYGMPIGEVVIEGLTHNQIRDIMRKCERILALAGGPLPLSSLLSALLEEVF